MSNGGTSGFADHLQSKLHGQRWQELCEAESLEAPKITAFLTKRPSGLASLVKALVKHGTPFSLLDDDDFKAFVAAKDTSAISSKRAWSSLDQQYYEIRKKCETIWAELPFVFIAWMPFLEFHHDVGMSEFRKKFCVSFQLNQFRFIGTIDWFI